jgi:hypothetical protein
MIGTYLDEALETGDAEHARVRVETARNLASGALIKLGASGQHDAADPAACICVRFRDTGGFRVGDPCCPVHGVDGTGPLDGPWDDDAAARDAAGGTP